ncbi:MAG: hypothetical protein VKJ86_06915 [Synechococcus sp.]|jgi:hypothetical protein|nr:hypothetical protein [Synechococcus sp.]
MSQCPIQDKTVSTLALDTRVKYLSIQAELELLLQQIRTTPQKQEKS